MKKFWSRVQTTFWRLWEQSGTHQYQKGFQLGIHAGKAIRDEEVARLENVLRGKDGHIAYLEKRLAHREAMFESHVRAQRGDGIF